MSGALKPDNTPTKPSSPAKERTGYECAEAAAALLNCVAERSYNEMKCIPLMKKLRACIEKQVQLLLAVFHCQAWCWVRRKRWLAVCCSCS